MEIRVVAVRGFCAGVVRAIKTVEALLEKFGPPIYVKHKIVHNHFVLQNLIERGVCFVQSIDEIPEGSICVFSAHGVAPVEREKAKNRKLRIVDATCGLVTKVHSLVLRDKKSNIPTIIIGHKDHVEVIGIQGESPNTTYVVETINDVEQLMIDTRSEVGVVTQTTLSLLDVEPILKALEGRFKNLKKMPSSTICYATTNRQNALINALDGADRVIVVGDIESSNANRLVEIGQKNGILSFLVSDEDKIDFEMLKNAKCIVITSGASVPESLFDRVLKKIQEITGAAIRLHGSREQEVVFELPKI